jgi:CheY-like chemotaxis protein
MESKKNLTLKSLVNKELNELLSTLDGNVGILKELVAMFIQETPLMFDKLEGLIIEGKMKKAAEVIHQVKARYGYLGLEHIMAELNEWEMATANGSLHTDHNQYLAFFKEINTELMSVLKETQYYEPPLDASLQLPLAGKRVLIAEDDPINAKVFELFIQETGASVIITRNGAEALKESLEKKPDLIFMDIQMPYINGLEAIRELRQRGSNCPIVSLSASARLGESKNSMEAGASEFMVKPASRKSIVDVLMKYLS